MKRKRPDETDDSLGMEQKITRKDFLNTTLLGMGAALLHAPPPAAMLGHLSSSAAPDGAATDPWTGPGGIGDYANSNGNTRAVIDAAHKIRDGAYVKPPAATDTGESYDLVIVGGGLSGLAAAYYFVTGTGSSKKCLVLENHPIFGGEAKQNEFIVNGVHLIGPQGSNEFGVSRAGTPAGDLWDDLKLPRQFTYESLDPSLTPLRIPLDNYAQMDGVNEFQVDIGYFFDQHVGTAKPTWLRNIWQNDLADAPFSSDVKRDLLRWRSAPAEGSEAFRRKLDTMTYRDFLETEMGLRPEVTKYIEPVVGLINGASPDAVSAFAAQQIGMPGVSRPRGRTGALPQSFPGGNGTYARHFVKRLIPDGIAGDATFENLLTAKVNFAALDRPGQPTRIRVGCTVVRVEHAATAGAADRVHITYARNGKTYRVQARSAIMASGGWVNKHVIGDLPAEMQTAYGEFIYSPALVVNVALTNWRFLYKLGAPSVRWFGDDFGFTCNIRRPMTVGDHTPPLHPDQPTVLTFYMGLYTPGRPAYEQGVLARAKLFAATYADYERTVRGHMVRLFSDYGFDAKKDIAGIILNRWGHARLVQTPGFYYGRDGKPASRTIIERGFGRIAIGHSELNGHQSATGAIAQGKRAAEQIVALG